MSSGQKAQLEERQKEEEKVRAKLASLSAKLQQLGKETVALVGAVSVRCSWCMYPCAQTRQRDRDSRTYHQAKARGSLG